MTEKFQRNKNDPKLSEFGPAKPLPSVVLPIPSWSLVGGTLAATHPKVA